MSNSDTTTTEAVKDETSDALVSSQSETDVNTTQDSTVPSSETPEETTTQNQQQPSLDDLQAQIRRMESALKKANAEAKTHRLEANELKKFKEQVEAEKLSETEKQELARKNLEQQLADAKKQYDDAVIEKQQIRVKHSVQLQAAKLGVDPDVAEKLLDWAAIDYEDDGSPKNISTLLSDLIKTYPYLVKTNGRQAPTTSGGATNPPRSTTSSAATTPEEYIKRMEQGNLKQDEYDRLPASVKADIQRALIKARSSRR